MNNCNVKKRRNYNVVLIVIDTLRADHLPFYGYKGGYKKNTAPFLNSLSKKSVIFKHAFAASSWTAPATASIFTSLYPFQHGVQMGLLAIKFAQKINPNITINRIPEKIKTITEILKSNGYKTFGISDNLNIGKLEGFTQGFDKFETYGYERAPFITKRLMEWQKDMKKNGKYFLFIQFMDPHAPYHGNKPWYKHDNNFKKDIISRYDSEIRFVDSYIKKLYNEFGWNKNTLLIITADHGEGLWDHGHMDHGKTLYIEEIHVPLIFHYPEIKKKKIIYPSVSTIDILPTVRDILGIKLSNEEMGKSLVPLIESRKNKLNERYLYSHLWKNIRTVVEFKATIHKNWHFIMDPQKNNFLYDMSNDRKERENLYSAHKELTEKLKKKFIEFYINSKKYTRKKVRIKLTKEKLKKLKSLGYVQ
jgi:arylsulfatase A-like enzyme